MDDSVVRGYLMMENLSRVFFLGVERGAYLGLRARERVCGR